MEKILLPLLLLPLLSFAQNLTGKWQDKNVEHITYEFKADGTFIRADAHDLNSEKAQMQYRTFKEGGKDKVEVELVFNGKTLRKGVLEYSIKGDTLFIASQFEGSAGTGRMEEYVRIQ